MPETRSFAPDWVSPPGDTISDLLEQRGWSVAAFAGRMGQSPEQIEKLVTAHSRITNETAGRLQTVLGATAGFWLARERAYREALEAKQPRAEEESWLRQLPLRDMINWGWIPGATSRVQQLSACLGFFDVPDVRAWRAQYRDLLQQVAFRTSPTYSSTPASVAAWLRRGEVEAAAAECGDWDRRKFEHTLQLIRPLTRKRNPSEFLPELRKRCAACGVAVVIARAPSGCRASGATRFLSRKRALLMLSFRYLSDDHFWFTFFHEAGHLVLHRPEVAIIEGSGRTDPVKEQEANRFAENVLVPDRYQERLQTLPIERHAVRHFARELGVSPGIIIGQLQYSGRASQRLLNGLKARFTWE